jgi:hypothetical protein
MRQPICVGSSITTRGGDAKVHDRVLLVVPIQLAELLLGASQADLVLASGPWQGRFSD